MTGTVRQSVGGSVRWAENETTEDLLLGGRLRLRQPRQGYRAAIDPLILAASVPARPGHRVLDLGTGTGAAALALGVRTQATAGAGVVTIDGLEIDPGLAALARENAARNGFSDRFRVALGDVASPPASLSREAYDHVMANPPFHRPRGSPSPDPGKARARTEGEETLGMWVSAALAFAKPHGAITIVHRSDRLDEVMAALHGRAGDLRILPIWPKAGRAAIRIVVRAKRGRRGPAVLASGLVLHEADGSYTEAAEAVLRHAAALDF